MAIATSFPPLALLLARTNFFNKVDENICLGKLQLELGVFISAQSTMAVASKTHVSNYKRQKPLPAKGKSVRMLASSRSSPVWLTGLYHLQNRCATMTRLLVTTLLIAYGWSAYSQHSWQQAHSQLETLKKQERQLMQKNEVLKNDLSSQAQQPEMGLVYPSPAEAIALEPSSQTVKAPNSISPATPPARFSSLPVGY